MLPEEKARVKIDKQSKNAGWDIVSRNEYVPKSTSAVKEGLMQGNTESDYLLFVDDKAIAVVEAKREDNPLGPEVEKQAEGYARSPQSWYGLWYQGLIPLVYMANGKKIYFKNMLMDPDGDYVELSEMHSPKKMLSLINQVSEYGALPRLERRGLRGCQYEAELELEKSMKDGKKNYLDIHEYTAGKAGVRITDTPSAVYTFDAGSAVLIANVAGSDRYLGTYNTYSTISASATSYITGENAKNVGVTQFPAYLFTAVEKQ